MTGRFHTYPEVRTIQLKKALGQPWKKAVEPLPTYTEAKNGNPPQTRKY